MFLVSKLRGALVKQNHRWNQRDTESSFQFRFLVSQFATVATGPSDTPTDVDGLSNNPTDSPIEPTQHSILFFINVPCK